MEEKAAEFHNALRILRNIAERELRRAGVVDENWGTPEASDRDQLAAFIEDPMDEAIRMPDANFERLFEYIDARRKGQA